MTVFYYLFSIDYVFIKILDYPLSLLELLGTISGLLCVYLTAREKVICWPIGIVNIVFFFIMFYQVRLYSDMILQVYFLATTIYGWWNWKNPKTKKDANKNNELKITMMSLRSILINLIIIIVATFLLGFFMSNIHTIIPQIFKDRAAFPFLDAFTTVGSINAQLLMAQKKRECWILWVIVDIVATIVYFMKGINLVAIEYIVFGIIAFTGFLSWDKTFKSYALSESTL